MKKRFKLLCRRGLALSLALTMCMSISLTAFAEEKAVIESVALDSEPDLQTESVDNGNGTITVTDITKDVWATENVTGESETTTATTTDTQGNVVEESIHITGSETKVENTDDTDGVESEETGVGNISVSVKPGESNDGSTNADDIVNSLKPDISGEEWKQNKDGSHSKTEDLGDESVTTTVTDVTDGNGKTIGYTTQTVTTKVETASKDIEAPEAGRKENEDGSVTTVTVETNESGVVIGYTEVTERLNEAGEVVSSVTKTVSGSGSSTLTTTTTSVETKTVAPDAEAKVTVDMSKVTEGEGHGAFETGGLKITDTPTEDNGLVNPTGSEEKVDLEQLGDDELVFVSGIGLVSKYELTAMWSQNKKNWQKNGKVMVRQYIVKDKDGKEHPVYCADMSVNTENGVTYYLENTEDADYYTNPNNSAKDSTGGAHLREIATNGYWGTEEGMGSLSELVEKLLKAKEEGNSVLQDITEDQIKSLTSGQAMAATQAAIWKYGNSLSLNPFSAEDGNMELATYVTSEQMVNPETNKNEIIKTTETKLEYNSETDVITRIITVQNVKSGETTITTETIELNLPDGVDVKIERDPETQEIKKIYIPQYREGYIKLLPDNWLNNPSHSLIKGYAKKSEDVQLIEAVYKYLVALESDEDKTTDLIKPSDIVEAVTNVKQAVKENEGGNDVDKYEADVSFVLTVEQTRLNGDLLVHVYDADTGELITTRRVAGDDSKDDSSIGKTVAINSADGKSTTYTIDGLQLANGQTVRINLVGSQKVEKGAYLITAETGYEGHQTFVSVEEGERKVDLNFTLTLKVEPGTVNVVENTEVKSERTWSENREVTYNYYTLDLPDSDPTPDPTPGQTPDPNRNPDPDPIPILDDPTPLTEIPEENVPLANIPEGNVPLAVAPNGSLVEIVDEDVPLAVVPGEDLVDIFDEDVPLAEVPETGDISVMWYIMIFLSACGLIALNLCKRREN